MEIFLCLVFFGVIMWFYYAVYKWDKEAASKRERKWRIDENFLNDIIQEERIDEKAKLFLKKREFDERECATCWNSSSEFTPNKEWKEMFKEMSKGVASSEDAIERAQIIKEYFTDAPLQEYYSQLGFDFKFSGKYDDAIVMFEKCSELGVSGAWQWAASARNKKRQQEGDRRKEKLEQERRERRTRIEKDGNFSEVRTGKEYELFIKGTLERAGYQVEMTPDGGDQGVDIIISIGERKIAIQCKFYSSPVGNAAVMQVAAGRDYYDCTHAMVVTNSSFTKQAKDLSFKTGVWLERHEDIVSRIGAIVKGESNAPKAFDEYSMEEIE